MEELDDKIRLAFCKKIDKSNKYYETIRNFSYHKEGKYQWKAFSALKTAACILAFLIISSVAVYAAITLYNHFEYDGNLETSDFEYTNGFLYKKIYSYNDYLAYKEKINLNTEIKESDFNENFIIIIATDGINLNGLSLDSYRNEEDILQIKLVSDKNIDKSKLIGISILIDKRMDRDKVQIEKVSRNMNMKNYKSIESLPKDYSKEQAIQDKCLVIDHKEERTYNKDILEDFIKLVNKKENANIRIYELQNDRILIQDVEYVSGEKFYVCYDKTRYNDEKVTRVTEEIYSDNIEIIERTQVSPTATFKPKTDIYRIKDEQNEFVFGVY